MGCQLNQNKKKRNKIFQDRIRTANLLESSDPVQSYHLLTESLEILRSGAVQLSNHNYYEQILQHRLNYLKKKVQKTAAEEKQDEELDIPLTVDNSDMETALKSLQEEFDQQQTFLMEGNFSEGEQKEQLEKLKKWRNDQELRILIEFAGGNANQQAEEKRDNQTPDKGATSEEESLEELTQNEILEERGKPNPFLNRLQPTEIEEIWEYYFLHSYQHPTPNEFYKTEEHEGKATPETHQYITRMFQQVIEYYSTNETAFKIEELPGSSKVYCIGDLFGHFETVDKLLRFFMPKIFEAQATETPLRLVFLGNFTGGNPRDFHVLLYLLCFKLLYPKEVIFIRGSHEDAHALQQLGLSEYLATHFNPEITKLVTTFYQTLPVGYRIESEYKSMIAVHGWLPIDTTEPLHALVLKDQALEHLSELIEDLDNLSHQLIYNQLATRLDPEVPLRSLSNSLGYKINQNLIPAILVANQIDLVVSGNISRQSGHKLIGGNLAIAIVSALEWQEKKIHGKFLEVIYPADPEYPEYPEEEPEDEEESEKDEEPSNSSSSSEEDEEEQEEDPVIINLMDVEAL